MSRRLRQLIAVVCGAGILAGLGGCGPLGQEGLQREIEGISSTAAEGSLVADGVAGQGTKITFVRVHSAELAGAMEQSAEKLNDATLDPELRPKANEAIALANDVSSDLGDLEVAPDDEAGAARIAAQLRRTAKRAEKLAATL
jgi:hypothetical protein